MLAVTVWEAAGWPVAIAASITALGVIWRSVIRPIIRWGKRLETAIGYVEHELKENSGKSTKDAINRIDARLEAVEERMAELGPQQIVIHPSNGGPSGEA